MDRVVGFVRFSVISRRGAGAYNSSRDKTFAEAAAVIFDEARLRQRLDLFELMPAASLKHQTDRNFAVKILTSIELPPFARQRLEAICSSDANLEIVEVGYEDDTGAIMGSFCPNSERVITFRLDDDDALHPEHVADLRVMAHGREDMILTSPFGIYLQPYQDALLIDRVDYAQNAFGIGYISRNGQTIWDQGPHHKLDERRMVRNKRSASWIRSTHAGSDSGTRIEYDHEKLEGIEHFAKTERDYSFVNFQRLHDLLGKVDAPNRTKTSIISKALQFLRR